MSNHPSQRLQASLSSSLVDYEATKDFDKFTSYKVLLEKIRQFILKVESASAGGVDALGPRLGELEIGVHKGKDRGLGQQQLMISTFNAMSDSLIHNPPTDSTAIDSFRVFKNTIIEKTLVAGKLNNNLSDIFPDFFQKLYHLIYFLENIVSSIDSELYFESLTLKNLGGKTANGTGSVSKGTRVSPMEWMKRSAYTPNFLAKHPWYFENGRYKNIMKSKKIEPFHLSAQAKAEIVEPNGAPGISRKGDPLISENSAGDYVTLFGRDSFQSKQWFFKEDWGAKDCVIYMNSVKGLPSFYKDVVLYKDEATKAAYREQIKLIVIHELGGGKTIHEMGILEVQKHDKFFEDYFVEITLDYATSTQYTHNGVLKPFPFLTGSLFYDSWPTYSSTYADDRNILAETTHSYNEKSGIYSFFGIDSLYNEAKEETDPEKKRDKTLFFLNSWHKCDKSKATKALQELILDHILIYESELFELIPGFGFDEIESLLINYINKNSFKKDSSVYILRDLYEAKRTRTNRIVLQQKGESSSSAELTGQVDLINNKEVHLELEANFNQSMDDIFKSIGIPTRVPALNSTLELDLGTLLNEAVVDGLADSTIEKHNGNVFLSNFDISNIALKAIAGNDTLNFKFVKHEDNINAK